jgi:ubiquinone/menaquinone biosynthesis C-methylase UbiE
MMTQLKDIIASYDKIYETEPLQESASHYRWVFRTLAPESGRSLLDIASGGGRFLKEAENQNLRAVGLDFSQTALKLASHQLRQSALIRGNAEALPVKDAAFDYVASLGSLEHFLNPEQAAKEMVRVRKTGGRAAVLVPNSYFLMTLLNVWRTGSTGETTLQIINRPATRKAWQNLLELSGLNVESVHKYNYRSRRAPWKYRLIRPWIPLNLSYHFLFICRKP